MDSHPLMFAIYFLTTCIFLVKAETVCPKDNFECSDGQCVMYAVVCNGVQDCEDGSDEVLCIDYEQDPTLAALAAAQYILSQMEPDYGWENFFTPRSLIALSFLERELLTIPETEKTSMLKRLHTELLFILHHKKVKNVSLPTLAMWINALYATCEDPRDFHGNDLVELLRINTDEAIKGDFKHAAVLLTLCLAKDTRFEDFDQLIKIYDDKRNDGLGLKALTVIAMAACHQQVGTLHHNEIKARVEDFFHRYKITDNIGVYSKAFVLQAYNAWQRDSSTFQVDLLRFQAEDGSFGDLLSTYAVIPALLNTSIADLQCKTRNYEIPSKRQTSLQVFNPQREVICALDIPIGDNTGNHSLRISFDGRKSLYEILKLAEAKNHLFKMSYDELVEGAGKKVNSIAGITNDLETGYTWHLYKKSVESETAIKESGSIDWIYPEDGDIFVFKLE